MLGTVVNAAAIIIGSLLGVFIKGGLKEKYKEVVMQAIGMSVVFVGLASALPKLTAPGANPVLFIVSLVVGGVIGTAINIEARLESFGNYLQKKIASGKSDNFSRGFVSSSLLFCIGTMAILGSFESGLQGVHTILFAKSMIDGISSIIFASVFGIGVALSAVSVFLYQGAFTMLAEVLKPYLSDVALRELSIVGGVLITCIGFNMLDIKKIKVGNLLPAVFIPVIYLIFFK